MLDKFEFLIALARERHFRRAAERCGVTQPTLSAGIRQLEQTIGAALVNRGSRYIGLTPEGERVLDWARRITADARAMKQEVDVLRRGMSGVVRLAVIPTALSVAARLCTLIAERHPGVRFSVRSASSKAIIGLLDDIAIDGAITYLDNDPLPDLRVTPIYREGYRLVTAADGPFGRRASVDWAELAGLPLCLFTPDMQNRRIVEQTLAANADGTPGGFSETNSSLVMAAMVSSGRWSSIMPPALIEAVALAGSVTSVPIVEPQVSHSVGLVVADREPAPAIVSALTAAAERMVGEFDR